MTNEEIDIQIERAKGRIHHFIDNYEFLNKNKMNIIVHKYKDETIRSYHSFYNGKHIVTIKSILHDLHS